MTEKERQYEMEKQKRKVLIAEEQKQASSFDKYLVAFAAGTFGLSSS
jgi:hypothetical protein